MSTSFTIWHYLAIIFIATLLSMAIVYTLKQKNIPQKWSYLATYCVVALMLLGFTLVAINGYTKQVLLVNVKNHRFLSTESIIYTGTVRNSGDYDVGHVEIEIEIFDKGIKKQGRSSYESTAFNDYFNDVDIRKLLGFDRSNIKPTSFLIRKTVAKGLKAREGKQFAVSIDYPSYFHGYTSKERIIVH